MEQRTTMSVRPPTFLRVSERAVDAMRAVSGAKLPPTRRTQYRRWRSRGGQPSPMERVMATMVELHGCGVGVDALRQWPLALDELLNDLSCGIAHPRITTEFYEREALLQGEEDVATMRAALHDTPEAHTEAARALRAEALHGLEMARAHEHRARELKAGR